MEKQIEKKTCKNCIHYQFCVDTFRKAKQDGEVLLIEEEAYFADAGNCDYYADNRIYRKQSDGEWIKKYDKAPRYVCSVCNHLFNNKEYKYCPNCGAYMKGKSNGNV